MEADKVAPPSTEPRTPLRIFWKVMFSCCPARISRHCTRGKPASIITENWRVKMANSLESTPLPPKEGILNSLPFSESLLTLICSRASVAFTSALVPAVRSPWTVAPVLLVPRYVNTGMTRYLLLNFLNYELAHRRTGTLPADCCGEVTPRLIRSCNSSGFEERASATFRVIHFWK